VRSTSAGDCIVAVQCWKASSSPEHGLTIPPSQGPTTGRNPSPSGSRYGLDGLIGIIATEEGLACQGTAVHSTVTLDLAVVQWPEEETVPSHTKADGYWVYSDGKALECVD
jgi:hypothetical protein